MNKPWRYKNWLVWPNTIISNLFETSCTDSNIGVCLKDVKIEQCIESCSKYCSVGYFIELSNGKTICLPLDNIKYKDLSPYNLLTPQKDTEFKNMNISVFVNTNEFPFPPKDGENIYYNDRILITTEDGKLSMGSENSKLNKSFIKMVEKQSILTFLPFVSLDEQLVNNITINFNQNLLLNVNQTDIILSTNGSNLIWDKILTDFTTENEIKLIPQNKDKNNKKIKIGDKFKIKSNDMFVKIRDDNSLVLDKIGSFFQIKQMEKGYYCDKKKCKSTEINSETLKNLDIGRRPDCFNLCHNSKISNSPPKKPMKLWWLYLIIGIVILIIIIVTIFKINF